MAQAPVEDFDIEMLRPRLDAVHEGERAVRPGMIALAEEARGEHRRQGERDEEREQARKDDGQAELAEVLPRHALHEGNRHEDGSVAERDGDGRHADLRASLLGRLIGRLPHLQVAHDVLEHDNRVVDEDADAERHAHQGHHVECEAREVHDEERRYERRRDRDHDGRRRAPAAQEQEEHKARRNETLYERVHRAVQRGPHVVGIVRDDDELVVGIRLAQFLDALQDVVGRLDDVGIAVLVNQDIDGVLAVESAVALCAGLALADLRDGRQRDHLARRVLHLDLLDVARLLELRDDAHVRLRRLREDRARRHELVLALDGRGDLCERQLVGRHLLTVDVDGDFLVAAAVQLDLRDAARLLQHLREDIVRRRVGVGEAVVREHSELDDRLRVHVALDDDRRVGLIGQLVGDGLDLLARVDGRRVGIRREVELERHTGSLVARRRRDLLDARHGGQRVFDRLDDLLLHRLRARARVLDRDRHIRRVERR